MRALYTFTIFLSAALLFLVEPMVARMILPVFGGSAQVWNSCLVFFQGVLLLGYGYAHLSTKWLGARNQWRLHLPLMAAALAVLIFQGFKAPTSAVSTGDPSIPLLGLLAVLIGLPFFAVSAGSSILQRWFASTNDKDAHNPYFLYSASNIGSLLALLAYPLLLEPKLGIRAQTRLWEIGLALLIVAMAVCALALVTSARAAPEEEPKEVTPPPASTQRATWVMLAAVPSSLLLGVTTFLSTNIAPIPLMWVVPLSLYLITFILAFANKPLVETKYLARFVPLIVLPLALAIILESSEPLLPLAILHLLGFFMAAWMCHSRLTDTKPAADHLTEFYFWIALGGVVGGIFNALIAPLIFKTLSEYPIALVAACLLRPPLLPAAPKDCRVEAVKRQMVADGMPPEVADEFKVNIPKAPLLNRWDAIYPLIVGFTTLAIIIGAKMANVPATGVRTMACLGLPMIACFFAVDRPMRFGLALGAVFLAAGATHVAADGEMIVTDRSFFGVHRVTTKAEGRFYQLTHGNTVHGIQDKQNPTTPLTYYYPNGPIGTAFKTFHGPTMKHNIALVGLGVGSLSAYGEPGQHMDYYEIDPVVRAIATNPHYFTFIRDSKADVKIIMGDARLSLANAADHSYDMIVLDAFSSDAIPVHLLTEEAFRMYDQKLAPHGILCVHISNRYLDLSIVLGAIARDLNYLTVDDEDGASEDELQLGKRASKWVFMAKTKADLAGLDSEGSAIEVYATTPAWTDDFSNVLSVFKPGQ